jgi:hypothetical protein
MRAGQVKPSPAGLETGEPKLGLPSAGLETGATPAEIWRSNFLKKLGKDHRDLSLILMYK